MSFPFFGKEFVFSQPDGSELRVRGWGDQYRARFETLDGQPVVHNPQTGFWEYRGVAPRAGGPAEFAPGPDLPAGSEKLYITSELSRSRSKMRWRQRREQARASGRRGLLRRWLAPRPKKKPVGKLQGLCLPIAFPDCAAQIDVSELDAFLNKKNYSGFGNNGSVYDYFVDNSKRKLELTNIVTPYYVAKHERSHYTDPTVPYGDRASELITEALNFHLDQNFDFSGLSADNESYVYAISAFYAGPNTSQRNKGLWAHQGALSSSIWLAQDRWANDYMIMDMGSELPLGTCCHELGHLVCDFPDLYDDGDNPTSAGSGLYCLMSAGGATVGTERNPTNICAYLKYKAGWAAAKPITDGFEVVARADGNEFFIYRKSDTEYYIIENRLKADRDAELPGSGLAIWHIDELGDNSRPQRTNSSHYECTLVQADGRWDLENRGDLLGDDTDLYHRDLKDRFDGSSDPASTWWDGTASGLEVFDIGPSGPTMQFRARLRP